MIWHNLMYPTLLSVGCCPRLVAGPTWPTWICLAAWVSAGRGYQSWPGHAPPWIMRPSSTAITSWRARLLTQPVAAATCSATTECAVDQGSKSTMGDMGWNTDTYTQLCIHWSVEYTSARSYSSVYPTRQISFVLCTPQVWRNKAICCDILFSILPYKVAFVYLL